jgi:AGCS family alanine or glycine:cation symporter
MAFEKGFFGHNGQYIVAIGLLLFAFSTSISWSYYGERAVLYLLGATWVVPYRVVYVVVFFVGSFADTTVIWTFSGLTIAFMTIPNLIGLLILHRDVKASIAEYWQEFKS